MELYVSVQSHKRLLFALYKEVQVKPIILPGFFLMQMSFLVQYTAVFYSVAPKINTDGKGI